MNSESVISPSSLASAILSQCNRQLPGLKTLLSAALRLSVTAEEGRYARAHICSGYKELHPLLVSLNVPLEELPRVAPAVHYPDCGILCTWKNKTWIISGITQADLPVDGVHLDLTGPLSVAVTLPNQPIAKIKTIRGQIFVEDTDWQTSVARLGHDAKPAGKRDGGTSAFVLARAIYKVSISGHGGAFLVLPSDPAPCLQDISIGCSAGLGVLFDMLLPSYGHMNTDLVEKCSDALSALTGVDGAVVMSRDLSLIGFNATINTLPTDNDYHGEEGHRHKSARMFCKKHRAAVGIVVSQDGPISVY